MKIVNRIRIKQAISCSVLAMFMIGIGWYTHDRYDHRKYSHKLKRIKSEKYRMTSPLLDVELPEGETINRQPISFKYKVGNLVRNMMESGRVRNISLYFRDLHDGPWFGINAERKFNAASMMKVPVMIAWLKRAEKNPDELRRTFVYDGKEDLSSLQRIRPKQSVIKGKLYTVEELLHFMLNYSDNNATAVLFNNLTGAELDAVLDGMDIDNEPKDDGNFISVYSYSGFFRILYNASFLNRDMSEKALKLLSLQDFPQGILAGVPQGTLVASKFGEIGMGEFTQLHELGIVYHPKGAYIIGIMTDGKDVNVQADVIREISAAIYAEVDARGLAQQVEH